MTRYALSFLLAALIADADAQPVYRCDDGLGHVAYQDKLCLEQNARSSEARLQPVNVSSRMSAGEVASYQLPVSGERDGNYYQRKQRRQQETIRARAETLRLQTLLVPSEDPRTVERADNQRRCQNALRIAALCGRPASTFSCDENGFHRGAATEVSLSDVAVAKGADLYTSEQCSLRAANGGY